MSKQKTLEHSSSTFNREPPWSSIRVEKLPALALCASGKHPHHWVREGKLDEKGATYAAGELYLHRGACIESYLRGVERGEAAEDLAHLKAHLDAIGYKPGGRAPASTATPPEIETDTLGADRIEAEIDLSTVRAEEISDADMLLIERACKRKMNREEVYAFSGWISNGEPDSYSTRMDKETTLRNFVADLNSGRGLCIAHSPSRGGMFGPTGEAAATMPVGKSYRGELVERPERGGAPWVRGSWYVVRGVAIPGGMKTDDVIRNIETGVWDRLSVGYTLNPIEGRKRGRYFCDVCNEELMSKKCDHIPGLEYEGKIATARIVDGSMREASLVYLNAAQGTVVTKARHFAEEGRLELRQVEALEQIHGVRILQPGAPTLGASKKTGETPETNNRNQENEMELARELLKGMVEAFRSALPESPLRVKVGALSDRIAGAEKEEAIREAAAALPALIAESRADYPALKTVHDAVPEAERSPEKIAALVIQAGEGRQYRADLTAAALAEGVRAEGATFDRAHWETALKGQELAFIAKQRDIWKGQADKTLESGRRSQSTPAGAVVLPPAEASRLSPVIPDAAFKSGR